MPGQSFRPGFGYSAATARRYSHWSRSQYSSDVLSIRFLTLVAVVSGCEFWSCAIIRLRPAQVSKDCANAKLATASENKNLRKCAIIPRYAIPAEIGAFCVLPHATNAAIAARIKFKGVSAPSPRVKCRIAPSSTTTPSPMAAKGVSFG